MKMLKKNVSVYSVYMVFIKKLKLWFEFLFFIMFVRRMFIDWILILI